MRLGDYAVSALVQARQPAPERTNALRPQLIPQERTLSSMDSGFQTLARTTKPSTRCVTCLGCSSYSGSWRAPSSANSSVHSYQTSIGPLLIA